MTWGVVKDGFDRMMANRALLGKKKTARELYKEEIESRGTKLELVNLAHLRERVVERLRRNRLEEIRSKLTGIVFVMVVIAGLIWLFININVPARKVKHLDKASLFVKSVYPKPEEGHTVITEFYPSGPKAAESFLADGVKVGTWVSYYESGEKFRRAVYDDIGMLTSETYYYKGGEVIESFPIIRDNDIHTITLTNHTLKKRLEFDFYDGKIIGGTYQEVELTE